MSPIDAIALNLHAQLATGKPLLQVLDTVESLVEGGQVSAAALSGQDTLSALRQSALQAASEAESAP